eukprot:190463-Prorocentrum_lima.AAC.1
MTSSLVGSEMCIRDSFRCEGVPVGSLDTVAGRTEAHTLPYSHLESLIDDEVARRAVFVSQFAWHEARTI